ncbi:MAG: hypothetical protein RIC54_15670 [Thalassobaculum sp.]
MVGTRQSNRLGLLNAARRQQRFNEIDPDAGIVVGVSVGCLLKQADGLAPPTSLHERSGPDACFSRSVVVCLSIIHG